MMTTMSDPGVIRQGVDFLKLVEEFDATQMCPECQILRTIRSRHCGVCHKCVERFDHHCPFINNCVGHNNRKYFIVFIFFAFLYTTIAVINGGQSLYIAIKKYTFKELEQNTEDSAKDIFVLIVVVLSIL
jgi:palmitoyltransferase